MTLVFVYGTLKSGNFNNRLLTEAEFLGPAVTNDAFPLVVGSRFNIPYMMAFPGTGRQVTGEVYRVTADQLEALDHLEMHPHLYLRQDVTVSLQGGESCICQSYFLVRPLPHLLQLPYLDKFVDGVDGKWYVNPLLRTGEPVRFEVQTPPDGSQADIEAWRKL